MTCNCRCHNQLGAVLVELIPFFFGKMQVTVPEGHWLFTGEVDQHEFQTLFLFVNTDAFHHGRQEAWAWLKSRRLYQLHHHVIMTVKQNFSAGLKPIWIYGLTDECLFTFVVYHNIIIIFSGCIKLLPCTRCSCMVIIIVIIHGVLYKWTRCFANKEANLEQKIITSNGRLMIQLLQQTTLKALECRRTSKSIHCSTFNGQGLKDVQKCALLFCATRYVEQNYERLTPPMSVTDKDSGRRDLVMVGYGSLFPP